MEPSQRVLFSGFPRHIGVPSQFSIFTEEHFDRVVQQANSHSNVYASISRLPPTGPETDKVFFDLDGKSDSIDHLPEVEQFKIMRNDPDVADSVLGDVVEEMQELTRASIDEGIPVVGTFSGKGVHIHQLYQTAKIPENELLSIGNKFVTELDLEMVDEQVFEPMRITKIPNTQRFDEGEETGVWTVPLTAEEMLTATVGDLLEWSKSPRKPSIPLSLLSEMNRPEMEVHEDYLSRSGANYPERPVGEETMEIPDDAEWIVNDLIDVPCVRERILTRDPHHKIRQNFAVMLFNYGFSIEEAHKVIRKLGWKDYDPEMTKKQLKNIYRNKYADMSCQWLFDQGFCVHKENPPSCPTYGWSGGHQEY